MNPHYLFGACLTAALFAFTGCGSGQRPVVPASSLSSTLQNGAYSGDLLYVSHHTSRSNDLSVYTYPGRVFVMGIPGVQYATEMCTDSHGNIFVRDTAGLQEFAHGGTAPINTLSVDGPCAYDPTTNDLAVLGNDRVYLYANESGTPQVYGPYSNRTFLRGTFDNSGNLYIIYEPEGSSWHLLKFSSGTFTPIELNQSLPNTNEYTIQFDGRNLVLNCFNIILQIKVTGSSAKVVRKITLTGPKYIGGFIGGWLQGSTFISPTMNATENRYGIASWAYPAGGHRIGKRIKTNSHVYSVIVSVAASR